MSLAYEPEKGLIVTRCVCGQKDALIIGAKNGHEVGKCEHCGVLRTLTRAPDYGTIYTDGDYYHGEHQKKEGHVPYDERFHQDFVVGGMRLTKLLGKMRTLDVGCSNGAFVAAASARGFDAHGLEVNVAMAEWAATRTGRPVYNSWGAVPYTDFDVITLHDVFEHVIDPVHELTWNIGTHLAPNGLLVLDVPDAGHADRHLPNMEWKHWRPEQHLWHWEAHTLCPVVRDNGFRILDVDHPIPGKLVVYARRKAKVTSVYRVA